MIKEEKYRNKFDVISFIHGIEHFSNENYKILFENVSYYLKPNGIFTGALPNNLPFTYRICPKCGEIFEIDGHLSIHTKASLRKLFENFSFHIIYLNDLNIQYYLKYKGLIKTFYRIILHRFLRKPSNNQLEFIIKPINNY